MAKRKTKKPKSIFDIEAPAWYVSSRLHYLELRKLCGGGLRRVAALYLEQEGKCAYCGCLMWLEHAASGKFAATADHKIARSNGGGRGDNLVCACAKCNVEKAARPLGDFLQSRSGGAIGNFAALEASITGAPST